MSPVKGIDTIEILPYKTREKPNKNFNVPSVNVFLRNNERMVIFQAE